MGMVQLCREVGGSAAEVPKGSGCIDKPCALAALSVVPDTTRPGDTFAVVFSLSHVIADGFTYYHMLSMLSHGSTLVAASATRKHDIVPRSSEATGEHESAFLSSKSLMCNVVGTMLFGRTPFVESYYVDPTRVGAAKSASTGVPFVSTNDVLVSAFGNTTSCRVLLMPINFRHKLENFLDTDAGNYEGALVFGPEDYTDPALIRGTLRSGGPAFRRGPEGPPPRALPGCCESLRMTIGMVTNWTFKSFDEMVLEGCQQMLHIPHCDESTVPFDVAVVYRPRAGQLAVACFVRSVNGAELKAGCPLGGSVSCAEDSFANTW
eukprot:TRINITY_DN9808_c0_g1_i1.p1 TRINITY_DN9808_c0_g1~~TRINITY_DN9808_c0_g1_i1.p1  ORF type:complete len:321 (+),score=53.43 TRINITY_DN9808_c0_g1_i1:392-1354(+)